MTKQWLQTHFNDDCNVDDWPDEFSAFHKHGLSKKAIYSNVALLFLQ